MIKIYVLVSFYDDAGLHKAGTITQVPEDEFNPLYMKRLPDIPTGASDLADLDDVNLTNLDDGEILIYQSSTGKWINGVVPAGAESLSELDDVDVASAANGNVLTYNSTDKEWKAAAPAAPSLALSDLTNVSGNPSPSAVLKYNSTQLKWQPGYLGLTNMNDTTLNVNPPANGDALVYRDGFWRSEAIGGGGGSSNNVVVSLATYVLPFNLLSNGTPQSFPTEYTFGQLNAILIGGDNVYFEDDISNVVAVTSSDVDDNILCGTFIKKNGTVNRLVFECTSGTNWTVTKYV